MGRTMILGEVKCQNIFWWDSSPKHSLGDENIKCYKACVLSPSKTQYCVVLQDLVSPSKLFKAHHGISVTKGAVLTLPQGCCDRQLSHLPFNPQ